MQNHPVAAAGEHTMALVYAEQHLHLEYVMRVCVAAPPMEEDSVCVVILEPVCME